MKKFKIKNIPLLLGVAAVIALMTFGCKQSFLVNQPVGALGDATVATKAGVNELLIGCYASLSGQTTGTGWDVATDNWLYGSVCGGDAHKGSDDGDQADAYSIARFETLPSNGYMETAFVTYMDAVVRCDNVLKILAVLPAGQMTDAEKTEVGAEAKFLRAHFNFQMQRMWNNVPYVDESIDYSKNNYHVPNSGPIWDKIEADFTYAMNNLPSTQSDVGRANKWAAEAYLGKVLLYEKKYSQAEKLFDDAIANGVTSNGLKYALLPKFSDNFDPAKKNGSESVFAYQAAVNTSTSGAQANFGDILNFPYNGPGGCCGFFRPSIELANSYRTNALGLPLLDGSYDNSANAVKNDQGILSSAPFTPDAGNLDPRIDWTMGRRGIPYLDWGPDPGYDWTRNQAASGPYIPIKNVFKKSEESQFTDGSSWTPGLTAINILIIRYADVLLMDAECKVENNELLQAESLVNQVRQRAANTADFVMNGNAPAANYVINQYLVPWTSQATARAAVQMERKLELAMEGHRFFDLVRWGEAATVIQNYFNYESQFTGDLQGAKFTAGKSEYFPYPQRQIDLSNGTLKQNPGY